MIREGVPSSAAKVAALGNSESVVEMQFVVILSRIESKRPSNCQVAR